MAYKACRLYFFSVFAKSAESSRSITVVIKLAMTWQNQQNGMCAQRRLGSAWASTQSDQSSLSAWRKLGSLATYWAQAKTLIRLGGCPGWSESSLGAVILLVLSRGSSIIQLFTSMEHVWNNFCFSCKLIYVPNLNKIWCVVSCLFLCDR